MNRKKERPIRSLEEELTKLLWTRVDVCGINECWKWTGRVGTDGYGRLAFEQKEYLPHRVAFMVTEHTKISRNILVIQKCGNKLCCNPAHFNVISRKQKLEEMAERGSVRGFAQRGEDNGSAKITNQQAREIKVLFATGRYSKTKLGRMYGVSSRAIRELVNGVWWKWLEK